LPEELRKGRSRQIDRRLAMLQSKLSADQTLFRTEGLNEGAIREIDITGVPPNVSQEVLGRYGIRIMLMNLNGNDPNPGFLSRAQTNEGQFVKRSGSGVFQVFNYGPPAIARMMQLEEAELEKQGLDPKTSRVVRVVFGVVRTTKGYDLGIKKLEAEPVPGLADEEETPPPAPPTGGG